MSEDTAFRHDIPEPPPAPPIMTTYQGPRLLLKARCMESLARKQQKEMQFKIVGAIESNDLIKVRELIEKGVDVNAEILYTKTPLTYALELGYSDIALYLLQNEADPDKPMNTEAAQRPIHLAVSHNACEILRELSLRGVDMNTLDGAKMTPLHYAAYYGMVNAFDDLVSYGAIIDLKDMSGKTPFHRAVEENNLLIAEKLLKYGANIDEQDIFGWPPIFQAVIFNDIEVVNFLLLHNCDVNIRDLKGNTVLIMGCNRFKLESMRIMTCTSFDYCKRTRMIPTEQQAGILYRKSKVKIDMIRNLLNAGVDFDVSNHAGERALYHATYAAERDVVELLVNAGAWIDLDWLLLTEQSQNMNEERSKIHSWLVSQYEYQFPLVNQCRRAIRKLLAQSRNIVKSIYSLPLPEKIQKFLLE